MPGIPRRPRLDDAGAALAAKKHCSRCYSPWLGQQSVFCWTKDECLAGGRYPGAAEKKQIAFESELLLDWSKVARLFAVEELRESSGRWKE